MKDKAWTTCKKLASMIELPENYSLQGEEREDYNALVAQDFYNLYSAYNKRYIDKRANEKISEACKILESI